MTTSTIRRLRPDDLAALGRFFVRNDRPDMVGTFHPFPLNPESAAALLHPERRDLFFGLWAGDELLAFSMLRGYDEGYEIPSFGIIVDHAAHGRGLGGQLTRWICRYAQHAGAPRVRLKVYRSNAPAVHIYSRIGFVVDETASDTHEQVMFWTPPPADSQLPVYASTACLRPAEPFAERVQSWLDRGLLHVEFGGYPGAELADLHAFSSVAPGSFQLHNYSPADQGDFVLNLSSPTPEDRTRSIDFYARSIRLTQSLRGRYYSLHGGFIYDPVGRDDHGFLFPAARTEADRQAAFQRFFASLTTLSQIADSCGVRLLVENNVCNVANRDTLLFDRPDDFARLLAAPDLQDVGILLDTGHLKVSAQTYGYDAADMCAYAPRIQGIHLHDNDGSADQHRPAAVDSDCLALARSLQPEFVVTEAGYASLDDLTRHVYTLEAALNP